MHPLLIPPAELRLNGVPSGSRTAASPADVYSAACKARKISNMQIRPGYYGDELGIK
jgi:hypothetical protein